MSLENAIQLIRVKTGATIVFKREEVAGYTVKTIDFKNATIQTIIHTLLQATPLMVNKEGSGYFILPAPKRSPGKESAASDFPALIHGNVIDGTTGFALVGAAIEIKNSHSGTVTDADGKFEIKIPRKGTDLVASYTGFTSTATTVNSISPLEIRLIKSNSTLNEVVVTAGNRVNTQRALLDTRRKLAVVSDGISAENIEKTASITTTQALAKVTGVTITDDKYVAVRGLGDRSVIGELNGIRLASSDPDRSTIPLDLVPANLLDNVTVYKTMTPDLPADASGGIVELKTRSIPAKQTLSFTAETGFNSNIGMLGQVNSYYNSDMGFLGQKVKTHDLKPDFLHLSKQYPGGFSQIQQLVPSANSANPQLVKEENSVNSIMHEFDPVLTTSYKKASLDGIYNITYGNSLDLFKHHKLGIIVSGSYYSRTKGVRNGELNQYSIYQGVMTGNPQIDESRNVPAYITPNSPGLGKYVGYTENTGDRILNYGGLGGLSYRFSSNHQISFQYMGSRGAETQATSLIGQYDYTTGLDGPVYSNVYSLKQTYRTFDTYNLQGEHRFGTGKFQPRLSYNAASSRSTEDDPDYRYVNLADYRPAGGGYSLAPSTGYTPYQYIGTTDYYALVSGYVNGYGPYGKIQADPNGRRYRNLVEKNYNYKADLTLPLIAHHLEQALKVGVNYLYRDRTFDEYVLSIPGSNFSATTQLPLYAVNGNLDQLVGYNQVGVHLTSPTTTEGAPLVSGFLYNSQKSPDNYHGFYETNAYYTMLDLRPAKSIRLTGGARWEKTNIQSKVDTSNVYIAPSISEGGVNLVYVDPVSKYIARYKPYYSANLTYILNTYMNFRFAYSTTLARPEIRELTDVFEFDPFQQALIVGNPNLQNQETHSYDFRWEWFPNPGDVLSASVFSKTIDNQIEKVFIQNSDGVDAQYPEFPSIEFQNDPNAGHVWGVEAEIQKDLGRLWAPLNHFFLGTNLLIARSSIIKNQERLNADRVVDRQAPTKSPLFEQAPYSINAILDYNNQNIGTDVTATFNIVGERLIQVNLDGSPDLYSRPQPVLDLVFSQKLTKRLVVKGYGKNILNQPEQEVYTNPNTGGTYYGRKYIRRSFKSGAEIMLGITYNLF